MEKNDKGVTSDLINFIIANVKLIHGITDTTQDNLLIAYTNIICNNLLIRTHRRMFDENMKYLVINLVADKFDVNNTNNPDLKAIQSLSEAGRSVNFGASNILTTRLNLIAHKQLDENESIIKEFRLLYRT